MPTPTPLQWGLYLISDEIMLREGTFLALLDDALRAGLRVVQLRAKTLTQDTLLPAGEQIRRLTRRHGATFIVNDDPELAVRLDADGVHVGQNDTPPEHARAVVGPDRLVGLSTHNRRQILDAADRPVDYIGVGPVFATGSKDNPDPVVGTDLLAWAGCNVTLPTVAIGGITLDTLDAILDAGARNIAVISAIARAADPSATAREFIERIAQAEG